MNLKDKLTIENIELFEEFYINCEKFKTLLQQWGKIHNLSGSLHDDDIEENIIDSVYPITFLDEYKSLADIGTGAGYPGMILAMAMPNTKVYLIEPRAKRVAFLNFVKNTLGLQNVQILCNRVEKVENIEVELITSRAVTNTSLLLDLTKNITCENSSFLFYKGSLLEEEIKEAKVNSGKIVKRKDRNYLYIKGLK